MVFNSLVFVYFFITVYAMYRCFGLRGQNLLLLLASYAFYAYWDWRFLGLILFSTVVDYICGYMMPNGHVRRKRVLLIISLCVNLGLLGFFKYYGFFIQSFNAFLISLGIEISTASLNVILPVGISFYTFQSLSYTIDIYRGELQPEPNFLRFALFVSFFPQLVAGPIERAKTLLPQLQKKRVICRDDIFEGLWFIYWGYYLKIFMADNLAPLVDNAFAHSNQISGLEALLSLYAFAFQIFGDFAGYSSIAIGLARLMGIRLMTNFLFPYVVSNPSDFWRNWHISLSSWLRDYLYISLGGNRTTPLRVYRNIMLTMLLGGLWHGASWIFVIWGLYQGFILIVHRLWSRSSLSLSVYIPRLLLVLFMFHVTCLGWLIFRASSFMEINNFLVAIGTRLFDPTANGVVMLKQLCVFTIPVILISSIQYFNGHRISISNYPIIIRIAIVSIMYVTLLFLGEFGAKQFIYFQF